LSGAHDILFPPLPYRIPERAAKASRDVPLQQFVHKATRDKDAGRRSALASAFGERADDLRKHAGAIKQHTLDHLDAYLERWIDAAEARGTKVHYAKDAAEANAIVLGIAASRGCRLCVKAKSMVTEETGLVPALERAGVRTVETDLGEFILQIEEDAPSHLVMPMIHRDRAGVGRAFTRMLGSAYSEDPKELTRVARRHMRDLFASADLGISGANFLLADTGGLVLCTNEGNADLSVTAPRVHVALVGIEKVIPSGAHLPVFIKLLARSATGQPVTVYTSVLNGPRRESDADGPEEMHVVLLDHGRAGVLASEARALLRCIRCGACLNACPVYRKVGGGHAYGSVYSGPIGAVLTPNLRGVANYPDLARASSLCGACREACPVDIDIPGELVRLRESRAAGSFAERLAMRAWAWMLGSASRYRLGAWMARRVLSAFAEVPERDGRAWVTSPGTWQGPLAGWTGSRDFPAPARESFRSWWKNRSGTNGGGR
jgi:L-lactate dehydrogenase complex protein LldF